VPIEPAGKATRVLPAGPVPAGCIAKGEVVVTVKSKVGFYNRNPLRVQEELETLARQRGPECRRQRRTGRCRARRWQPALRRVPVPAALNASPYGQA
jgi:hypothetical protein